MTNKKYDDEFVQDCVDIIRKETQGKVVSRRRFLGALAALGVAPIGLRLTRAYAASDELVVVNWGGDALRTYQKAWVGPFNAKSGNHAVLDGSGPSNGRIKAMVQSGAVAWDVCDRNLHASIELGRQDLLEEVDWNIVDKSKLRPGDRGKWGVGSYYYAFVLTWDSEVLPEGPKNWAEFWNTKDFPGRRTLRNNIEGMLEAALLADGVAPEDVYPIDVERAFEKIREIKEHTIFWTSGSQSQTLFRNRAVTMGSLWNTRAMMLRGETDGRVQYHFNEGILFSGAWIVPRAKRSNDNVWEFIAFTQDPETQIELFRLSGNGPINPKAYKLMSEDLRRDDPGSPENLAREIAADQKWYADNYVQVLNQYTDLVMS